MAAPSAGTVLAGRYRVVRRLGSGGMATVFLAEDERLGRQVAVKRLHAESPEEMAQRFQREAKVGASLNHPNIVSVYDTVTDGEDVLIVMEFVDGPTLAQELREGPLPVARATEVVSGVAAALDHAHDLGVVHRDVKPANVMLGSAVKLVDLGIATAAERTQITSAGTVLGTPAYMAPEQLTGGEIGPAVDIYALAAVAFETLGGRKARTGTTPLEIAHRSTTEPPPSLRELWPDAPKAAVEALCRGMDRDPARRPRSAGELARGLEQGLGEAQLDPTLRIPVVRQVPVPPAPRPAAERPPAPARRIARPLPPPPVSRSTPAWVPAALIGALLLALLIGGLVLASSGGDENSRDTAKERPAERSDTQTGGPSEDTAPSAPAEETPTVEEPPAADETRTADQPTEDGPKDPAEGRRLNDQGFALIQQGRDADAVPILQRSVAAFPDDSTEMNYAFALFNLGSALRASGRPADAIPFLEKRLAISDFKRGVVERELARAKQQAE